MRTARGAALLLSALVALAPVRAAHKASCFDSNSDPDKAIVQCGHLIASGRYQGEGLAGIYEWRSYFWFQKSDWARAISDVEMALKLGSTNKAVLLTRRGYARGFGGDYSGMLDDLDAVVRLNPHSPDALIERGRALTTIGDYSRAVSDFGRAIAMNPKNADAYGERGSVHNMLKDYDASLADFDQAIALDPSVAAYYVNRGYAWLALGKPDRSIEDLNHALRIDPMLAPAFINRGKAWQEKGDFERALADYDEVVRLKPDLPKGYIGRGLIWRARHSYGRALAEFDKAISLNQNLASAFAGRGLVYEAKGDIVSAKQDYNRALALPSGVTVGFSAGEHLIDTEAPRFKKIAKARLVALQNAQAPAIMPPGATKKVEAPSAHPGAKEDRRVALVIGNGAYPGANRLTNPPHDARAIAQDLRAMGFDVSEGIDLDRAGMKRKVAEFLRSAVTANIALLFYAGHGMQIDGKNFLLPVDIHLGDAKQLAAEMTDVDTILAGLDDQVRTNIVILDACRDNPLAHKVAEASVSRSVKVQAGLAAPSGLGAGATRGAGTLLAFATAPGRVALDGGGANSPFSAALAHYLPTPGLEVQQMLTRVRTAVVKATKGEQVPWSNSSLLGEVYLAK